MEGVPVSDEIVGAIAEKWPFRDRLPQRVVIKIGSNVLALPGGGLNSERIESICRSVAAIKKKGVEVIIVSSGAVAAGRGILGLKKRPTIIPELQAVAAIGQGALMEEYSRHFRPHGVIVAQILLNREDLEDRRRYLNARHALQTLLGHGVVPIINENDSVTIDELKFGDNDMLSSMVAAKMDADLLITLSNIPGLMTGHPSDPSSRVVPVVDEIDGEIERLVLGENSSFGTGGMRTKLDAARHATRFGVTAVIVNGQKDGKIERVIDGRFEGTVFLSHTHRKAGDARRHWIRSSRPRGILTVDAGAVRALVEKRKSLLPVGIIETTGEFEEGDIVAIMGPDGRHVAHGVVNYNHEDVVRVMGHKSTDHAGDAPETGYHEVVHSNNLVIL